MSYNTRFTLSTIPEDQSIIEVFRQQNQWAEHSLDDTGATQEPCSWYDHEADLCAFSKNYPTTTFILSGEGEEGGDLWKLYVRNGSNQRVNAKIVFDPPRNEFMI